MGYEMMNRRLFFLVAILALILIGCNYSNSQNRNIHNQGQIDKKKEINNHNQEILNTQALDDDEIILKEDIENKVQKDNNEKKTKTPLNNNNKDIIKNDNKKSADIEEETKINNQGIEKNDSEVKVVSRAPAKESNTSVESEPKPEEIEVIPKDMEAEIVKKYTEIFKNLQTEYEGKIDKLLSQAKSEYLALNKEKRSKQKLKLGFKYLRLGKSLEGECDKRFYFVLEQMKVELKSNSLQSNAAKEAEKQYKSEKSGRQKELLKKAFEK